MIQVKRPPASEPKILSSAEGMKERAAAVSFFTRRQGQRSPQQFRPEPRWKHPSVRSALDELFHGKCAYCESSFKATAVGEIEHYRPKARAMDLDGSVAPDHYSWLVNDWANLLFTCQECNRSKAMRFPVKRARAGTMTFGRDLRKERPILLDPCLDDPEKHFVFTGDGTIISHTERGKITIEILSLNRTNLVLARRESSELLRLQLAMAEESFRLLERDRVNRALAASAGSQLEEIRRRLAPSQEYAGLHRQLINGWYDELGVGLEGLKSKVRPLIRRAASKARLVTEEEERETAEDFLKHSARQQRYSVEGEAPEDKEAFYAGKKSIEWVEIQNFKAIERLELTFPGPTTDKEPWVMLLGENGMGKSSVLQGIALALMGEKHCRELGLDASSFVYRGAQRGGGRVRVKLTNIPEALEVRFRRSSKEFFFETPDPKVLLLGYGATRLLPPRGAAPDSDPNYIRIKNLFDPTARLSDIESWLLDTKNVGAARFRAVTAALKDLLMLESDDSIVRRGGDLNVNVRGQPPVGLTQLSAGFQSVVALSADIMKSLLERFSSIREAEGIVLLDELEAHLHPTWKIQIVERLRRTLPRVSFVVSTHDPLSLKGLEAGEIVVLRRDERRRIVPDTDIPPVNDLRADQILTSFLFGLGTTRGDEATAAISRYSQLSEKRELTKADEGELDRLRQRLDDTLTTRESPAQRRIEEAILKTLAEMEGVARSQPQRGDAPTAQEFELRRQLNELLGWAE